MRSTFLVFVLAGLSSILYSQTNNDVDYGDKYTLKKVVFSQPQGDFGFLDWLVIVSDFDSQVNISGDTETIAWENGAKAKPIGYVSGVRPVVEAEFEIKCLPSSEQEFWAYAETADGYKWPPKKLMPHPTLAGLFVYPKTPCDQSFPNEQVGYWEDFELHWTIGGSANGPWIENDLSSTNYMYVTHRRPILHPRDPIAQDETYLHHTVLHLSCLNADDLSDRDAIVDGIYSEFTDKKVKRFGGVNDMQYWGPGLVDPDCRTIAGFLQLENTTCGTWAQFFNDMVRIQGIGASEMIYVGWYDFLKYTPNGNQHLIDFMDDITIFSDYNPVPLKREDSYGGAYEIVAEFSVKEWNLVSSAVQARDFVMSESDRNGWPLSTEFSLALPNNLKIPWIEEDGAAGQGNEDPKSEFNNHAIVKYNGSYFDPSYGSPPRSSKEEWEDNSIDFFQSYVMIEVMIDNMLREVKLSWIAEVNSQNDTQLFYSN